MSYVISALIIIFLGIMIFTNVKTIIQKIKEKKKNKLDDSNSANLNIEKEDK